MTPPSPSSAPPLPPVVLFDGACALCQGGMSFIVRRDPGARFRFAALQSAPGRALLNSRGLDPDRVDGLVLIDGKQAYVRSGAVFAIARRLPGWWWAGALGWLVPRPLRDAGYGWVAANRHRLLRRGEACPLPDPALRERLLEGA